MLAKVYVTLKSGVLDPQGSAIHHSVKSMDVSGISGVRQGKYFEIRFEDGVSESEAAATADQIANDVLANPVIEDYSVELASGESD